MSLLNLIKDTLGKLTIYFVVLEDGYFLYGLWDLFHDSGNKRSNLLLLDVSGDDLKLWAIIAVRLVQSAKDLS